jgi:hypothetical protein
MRRIAISTAGIITALAISVTSAAAARATGPHSTVADVNLPTGSTQLQGGRSSAGTLKSEAWHYTVSYPDAVAYLKEQLDSTTFRDSAGHKMQLCPDAFGDPVPIVIKDETVWEYSDGIVGLRIDVIDSSKTAGSGSIPPDGHRIDIFTEVAEC